mmetsp:Transcript_46269/g.121360  ORF Transcript_46269/g.121360 Transcript_46269/m.121360 type:complete len:204 (+) Transcript_46269:1474-2085(+)
MRTFCSFTGLPALSCSSFLIRSPYMACCHSLIHEKRMNSYFLGMPISTSAFSLRNRNGRRIWWSLVTTPSCISPLKTFSSLSSREKSKSNHAWKESRSSKMFGRRKLSSDQSSVRLFCSGVPVSSSRLQVSLQMFLSSRMRRQFMFLSRWPSSITTNFHLIFRSSLMSRMTISYDVIITGKCFSCLPRKCEPRIFLRSSLLPW